MKKNPTKLEPIAQTNAPSRSNVQCTRQRVKDFHPSSNILAHHNFFKNLCGVDFFTPQIFKQVVRYYTTWVATYLEEEDFLTPQLFKEVGVDFFLSQNNFSNCCGVLLC